MKKRILFVSHNASRSGAPIVLCNIVRWLKSTNEFDITFLLCKGGPIESEFRAIAPTYILRRQNIVERIISRLIGPFDIKHFLPRTLKAMKFDLVYLNTAAALNMAPVLKDLFKCSAISHIHEMGFTIDFQFKNLFVESNLKAIDHIIAASEPTKHNLVFRMGLNESDITVIYETIEVTKISQPTIHATVVRDSIGVGNEYIIGGSGLSGWRKGTDLFVQLAIAYNTMFPLTKAKFVWVGEITREFQCQFDYEKEMLGEGNNLVLLGAKSDPQDFFQVFDVFVLSSREDPFPLVALEAASLSKPILCFSGSGGIPEFASEKNGIVSVPYADVKSMCIQIEELRIHRQKREELGRNAFAFGQRFDVAIQGKRYKEIIEEWL